MTTKLEALYKSKYQDTDSLIGKQLTSFFQVQVTDRLKERIWSVFTFLA